MVAGAYCYRRSWPLVADQVLRPAGGYVQTVVALAPGNAHRPVFHPVAAVDPFGVHRLLPWSPHMVFVVALVCTGCYRMLGKSHQEGAEDWTADSRQPAMVVDRPVGRRLSFVAGRDYYSDP